MNESRRRRYPPIDITSGPEYVIVLNPGGTKSHVMDRRYAPLPKAMCGGDVSVKTPPDYWLNRRLDCWVCRSIAETMPIRTPLRRTDDHH